MNSNTHTNTHHPMDTMLSALLYDRQTFKRKRISPPTLRKVHDSILNTLVCHCQASCFTHYVPARETGQVRRTAQSLVIILSFAKARRFLCNFWKQHRTSSGFKVLECLKATQ